MIAHGVAAPVRDDGNHALIVALADEGSIEVPGRRGRRAAARAAHASRRSADRSSRVARRPRRTTDADAGRQAHRRARGLVAAVEGDGRRARSTTAARIVDGDVRQTSRSSTRSSDASSVATRAPSAPRASSCTRLGFREEYDYQPSRNMPAHRRRAHAARDRVARQRRLDRRDRRRSGARGGRSRDRGRERHRLVRASRRRGVRQHARVAPRAARRASSGTLDDHAVATAPSASCPTRGANDFARCRASATRQATPFGSRARRSACSTRCSRRCRRRRSTSSSSTRGASCARSRRCSPSIRHRASTASCATYQRDGLAWLHFLQRFGFGGCLADDMGLGKTVQALALLEERRLAKSGTVARRRAAVAAVQLAAGGAAIHARDARARRTRAAIVPAMARRSPTTTSCSSRTARCAATRRCSPRREFDYVILDEAQAIKNATTETAKAARLLRARHRLAMSGTPVENRIAELWSLFEFLNPRHARRRARVQDVRHRRGGRVGSDAHRAGRAAVHPASHEGGGRAGAAGEAGADDLRGARAAASGSATTSCAITIARRCSAAWTRRASRSRRSRFSRRCCDCARRRVTRGCSTRSARSESSSKFDLLVPQLAEIVAEGHKALVFSQFTSLLALLKPQLDSEKVVYEYLDGQTRDREERVTRFQTDPACGVFLISLKAGGLGLNLTAADYVYLLDPWWNPAVEAQAIDRTHRIGQTRRVFASRLDRARHGRGEGARAAAVEARSGRGDHWRGQQPDCADPARGSRGAARVEAIGRTDFYRRPKPV